MVILSYVFEVLRAKSVVRVSGIRRLKFLQPVLFGQTLRVDPGTPSSGRLPVKIWRDDLLVAEGQLLLGQTA